MRLGAAVDGDERNEGKRGLMNFWFDAPAWIRAFECTSSAYGHAYSRGETPIAFWISALCSGLGLLMGAMLALGALTYLLTR